LNARHALNDYGVSDPSNKLHPEVLAQTNTAGGSSSVGGSSGSTGGGLCMWADDWCTYPPIDVDPHWHFLYPYRHL
jgi:hypothetical protein